MARGVLEVTHEKTKSVRADQHFRSTSVLHVKSLLKPSAWECFESRRVRVRAYLYLRDSDRMCVWESVVIGPRVALCGWSGWSHIMSSHSVSFFLHVLFIIIGLLLSPLQTHSLFYHLLSHICPLHFIVLAHWASSLSSSLRKECYSLWNQLRSRCFARWYFRNSAITLWRISRCRANSFFHFVGRKRRESVAVGSCGRRSLVHVIGIIDADRTCTVHEFSLRQCSVGFTAVEPTIVPRRCRATRPAAWNILSTTRKLRTMASGVGEVESAVS